MANENGRPAAEMLPTESWVDWGLHSAEYAAGQAASAISFAGSKLWDVASYIPTAAYGAYQTGSTIASGLKTGASALAGMNESVGPIIDEMAKFKDSQVGVIGAAREWVMDKVVRPSVEAAKEEIRPQLEEAAKEARAGAIKLAVLTGTITAAGVVILPKLLKRL